MSSFPSYIKIPNHEKLSIANLHALMWWTWPSLSVYALSQIKDILSIAIHTFIDLINSASKIFNRGFFPLFVFIFLSSSSYLYAMDEDLINVKLSKFRREYENLDQGELAKVRITKKESKMLLHAIRHDKNVPSVKRLDKIPEKTISDLRKQFILKKEELVSKNWDGANPNKPFYLILIDKYPDYFSEETFQADRFSKLGINLGTLLTIDLKQLIEAGGNTADSKLPRELIKDLYSLYRQVNASFPNYNWEERIFNWIFKGLDGLPLTLISPVCPDYSYEMVDGFPRYTFDTLGGGIGIVAQSVLNVLPLFIDFFNKHNLKVSIWVTLADVEAIVPENLDRLSITRDMFLKRIKESRDAIKGEAPVGVNVCMFSSLCEGLAVWEEVVSKFKQRFDGDDFGGSTLDRRRLIAIVKKRKPIYERWYGEKSSLEDYLPYLIFQGAQYASFASIIRTQPNCLILGADQSVMAPFYDVEEETPSLYIKSKY